jgi:hypothetical protein
VLIYAERASAFQLLVSRGHNSCAQQQYWVSRKSYHSAHWVPDASCSSPCSEHLFTLQTVNCAFNLRILCLSLLLLCLTGRSIATEFRTMT